MRITNSMMINRVVTNLNNGMNKMNIYDMQLSANRRMINLSDDPVGVLSSMKSRQNIRSLERYRESVTTAKNWVDQTETALMDIESVLITIKENVISACSTKNEGDKNNIAIMIESLNEHIRQQLNATVGDKYVFAGFNTTEAPFTVDEDGNLLYNGIDLTDASQKDRIDGENEQILEFEIGYNLNIQVSFTGADIVGTGDDNMFKILGDLVNDLKAGMSNEDLSNKYLGKLEDLRAGVTAKLVEVGTRTQKLEMMDNRYAMDKINYDAIRTDIEDIDQAEVIMKMKLSEAVYRQALAVGARIIQPTLMDYLH